MDDSLKNVLSDVGKYIRLAYNTKPEAIVALLIQAYKLPVPDLIISINTGGIDAETYSRVGSSIPLETRRTFQRGLATAAKITSAWVITSGLNRDVVSLVGKALNNDMYGVELPCIGFGSWTYTASNHQLEVASTGRSLDNIQLTRLEMDQRFRIRDYTPIEEEIDTRQYTKWDLEPNHTHFLLFDNGREYLDPDMILVKRREIEEALGRALKYSIIGYDATNVMHNRIPVVMLLLTGDYASLKLLCNGLEQATPTVILKDTGELAETLGHMHEKLQALEEAESVNIQDAMYNRENVNVKKTLHTETKRKLLELTVTYPTSESLNNINKKVDDYHNLLLDKKHLITVFSSIKPGVTLEAAIVNALIVAVKTRPDNVRYYDVFLRSKAKELLWTMISNDINYARTNILPETTDNSIPVPQTKRFLIKTLMPRALPEALRRNNSRFVALLVENGASFDKLNNRDIRIIFKSTKNTAKLPYKLYDKEKKDTLWNYNRAYLKYHLEEGPEALENAEKLFLWFIYMNCPEMAKYLCSRCRNQTLGCLLASKIYRRAAKKDKHKEKKFNDIAKEFDKHAADIIDACYDIDQDFAIELIITKAVAFYNCEPLDIAREADCRTFLATETVQKHLHKEWYHKFNEQQRILHISVQIWVFLCALIFPLLPIFAVCFPTSVITKKNTDEKGRDTYPVIFRKPIMDGPKQLRFYHKMYYFYKAPVVRFYYHTIFFVAFLTLFSYVLLVDYFPLNIYGEKRSGRSNLLIPITEIFLHLFIWSLMAEEVEQLRKHIIHKYDYIEDTWNVLDILGGVFYLIGFITRFIVNETAFTVSKIFMCIDLIIWSARLLHFFAAYEKLGPKLVMIYKMMEQAALIFVCFILILLFGFSITSWSLLTTSSQVNWTYTDDGRLYNVTVLGGGSNLWSWQLLRDVTNWGIWKVFGQIDEPYGGATSLNDAYGTIVFIFAILFVVIANLLLLNVLIAMFNATIHHIEAESKLIWRYQRFLLVQEYLGKTLLPPPLNIPCYIFYLLQFFWRKYCMTRVYMRMRMCCRRKRQTEPDAELKRRKKSVDSSIKLMNNYVETYQMRREKEIAEEYWKDIIISEEGKQRQMESDLSKMKIKVEKILNDFDQMRQRKKKGKFIDPEMQDVFKGIIIGDLEPVLDDQQDLPPTRSQTDRKATLNDAAPRQQSNDEVDRSQRAVSVNEDFCEEEKEVIEDEGEILPELSTECVASENSAQSSLPSWTGDQLTTNHPHIAPVQSTQLIYAASRRGKV